MLIDDDPSVIYPIFKQMRENLKSRQTHPVEYRKKTLKRLVEGYEKLKDQIDNALREDLGLNAFMTNFLAHGITKGQIMNLHDNLEEWVKPVHVQTPIALGIASSSIEYQPLGLVLVISAWNYPIYTALPQVAAAIAAGNSVILKPSQLAPYTSNVLAKLFSQYMDPKYYRCIQGKVQVAKAISQLPFDTICFTGSSTTGKSVAIEAAKNLTPCLLQLGGKCPVVVDETADIQSAVLRIIFGKFTNCGQTCVGVDHVYLHEKIADKFKQLLLNKIKQGYNINEIKTSGDYAKIINQGHVKRITELLNQNHHGKVLLQGVIEKSDRFISPFVIENPSNDSLLMNQQIFGPILPLKTYNKIEDVVKQINQRQKPLVVYVFSEDKKNIKKVKQSTMSGAFVVNDAIVQLLNAYLPFGGVGASGYGRYHGFSGFQSFSNPRSICETRSINSYPLSNRFAPYTESKKRMMTFLLKIGGITYDQIESGFKYVLLAASGIGLYFLNKRMGPTL